MECEKSVQVGFLSKDWYTLDEELCNWKARVVGWAENCKKDTSICAAKRQ